MFEYIYDQNVQLAVFIMRLHLESLCALEKSCQSS